MCVFSEEIRSLFAIVSLGLAVVGIFIAAIFLGPPAIALGILALYKSEVEAPIDNSFKICAFLGLGIGVLETILGILLLVGVITP